MQEQWDSLPEGAWQLFRSFQGDQIQNWFRIFRFSCSKKNTEHALLECKYLERLYSLLLFFFKLFIYFT